MSSLAQNEGTHPRSSRMKLVVFGLSVSSSWGNGHATLWRGLIRALTKQGHSVVFFERDVPYYAEHRDLWTLPGAELILYRNWEEGSLQARRHLFDADAAVVTSYCPDGNAACDEVLGSRVPVRAFYDLDTPVTLDALAQGQPVPYLPPYGLGPFDVVLSYTGGTALDALTAKLGARKPVPLYGSVDPEVHRPASPKPSYRGDLSYLGTYADNRQDALKLLFLGPSEALPHQRFVLGGAMYPPHFPWRENIYYVQHLPPSEHSAFYCSSRLTLNITRGPMAAMGYCPAARLFEAAACAIPVISDPWEGLDTFFSPGREILVAHSTDDVTWALSQSSSELARIGRAAYERTLSEHTAAHRAKELIQILESASTSADAGVAPSGAAPNVQQMEA